MASSGQLANRKNFDDWPKRRSLESNRKKDLNRLPAGGAQYSRHFHSTGLQFTRQPYSKQLLQSHEPAFTGEDILDLAGTTLFSHSKVERVEQACSRSFRPRLPYSAWASHNPICRRRKFSSRKKSNG